MTRPLFGCLKLIPVALALVGIGCFGPGSGPEGGSSYTADEVAATVDAWPSGWPGAGEVSTAIINICQSANAGDTAAEIHPYEASPLEGGRWRVRTSCDYLDADGQVSSFAFEWVFFEEGPRLEPSGGRAADVTGR